MFFKTNVMNKTTGCPRKKSLIKFFLDNFPTDVDYGPIANFVARHLVACQRSACYFFEGMTRSSRMLHSSAESWSVVHVRWEVVEEKFYQRFFSGTPCRISKKTVRPIFLVKGGGVTHPNPEGQGGPSQCGQCPKERVFFSGNASPGHVKTNWQKHVWAHLRIH